MKSNLSRALALLLGLALLAGGALAEGRDGTRGGARGDFLDGHMLRFFADYLGLTDAQQAQIKQIKSAAKPAMEPLFQQEHQSRQQMMQLIQSSAFNQTKAQAIANQEAAVHAQLEVQRASIAAQAFRVLSADQKTKLNEFMAQREQRWARHANQEPDAAPNQ